METKREQRESEREPELRQPEQAIKDLEPDAEASDGVRGGVTTSGASAGWDLKLNKSV